jgi:hypothetical protein
MHPDAFLYTLYVCNEKSLERVRTLPGDDFQEEVTM